MRMDAKRSVGLVQASGDITPLAVPTSRRRSVCSITAQSCPVAEHIVRLPTRRSWRPAPGVGDHMAPVPYPFGSQWLCGVRNAASARPVLPTSRKRRSVY